MDGLPIPNAVLDAGSESPDTVGVAIRRLLNSMTHGQILEVVSVDLSIAVDVPAWCRLSGQELVDTRTDHSGIHLWIRKRDDPSVNTYRDPVYVETT